MTAPPKSIEWIGGLDGHAALIDQTLLPETLLVMECRDVDTLIDAIRRLAVRGAPAIGIAAAMGLVLAMRDCRATDARAFLAELGQARARIAASRPTAVNLFWALDRMVRVAEKAAGASIEDLKLVLLGEAQCIRDEDARMCRAIGEHGAALIPEDGGVLTYCNAGALATSEWGTALAPLYVAHDQERRFRVYAPETRPLLQGSRLTAWELARAGIEVRVLCDGAVASLMQAGKIQLVITGADRIAANGDTANKIGTYAVACLAKTHVLPFYVAAPSSTFDLSIQDGAGIPIENRSPEEVRRGFGRITAPPGVECLNPAFDVTPASLIRGILTERGLIQPVEARTVREMLG